MKKEIQGVNLKNLIAWIQSSVAREVEDSRMALQLLSNLVNFGITKLRQKFRLTLGKM